MNVKIQEYGADIVVVVALTVFIIIVAGAIVNPAGFVNGVLNFITICNENPVVEIVKTVRTARDIYKFFKWLMRLL